MIDADSGGNSAAKCGHNMAELRIQSRIYSPSNWNNKEKSLALRSSGVSVLPSYLLSRCKSLDLRARYLYISQGDVLKCSGLGYGTTND